MSSLTRNEVIHIAKLAKLTLTEAEIAKFQKQLLEILNYIDELNEVETKGISPTSQTTQISNVAREDKVNTSDAFTAQEALSGSDKVYNNYFTVPVVINRDDI